MVVDPYHTTEDIKTSLRTPCCDWPVTASRDVGPRCASSSQVNGPRTNRPAHRQPQPYSTVGHRETTLHPPPLPPARHLLVMSSIAHTKHSSHVCRFVRYVVPVTCRYVAACSHEMSMKNHVKI